MPPWAEVLSNPSFCVCRDPERETFVQVSLHKDMANRRSQFDPLCLPMQPELKSLEAQFVQSQKMQAIGSIGRRRGRMILTIY